MIASGIAYSCLLCGHGNVTRDFGWFTRKVGVLLFWGLIPPWVVEVDNLCVEVYKYC